MSFLVDFFERYEYKNGSVVDKVRSENIFRNIKVLTGFERSRFRATCCTSSTPTGMPFRRSIHSGRSS